MIHDTCYMFSPPSHLVRVLSNPTYLTRPSHQLQVYLSLPTSTDLTSPTPFFFCFCFLNKHTAPTPLLLNRTSPSNYLHTNRQVDHPIPSHPIRSLLVFVSVCRYFSRHGVGVSVRSHHTAENHLQPTKANCRLQLLRSSAFVRPTEYLRHCSFILAHFTSRTRQLLLYSLPLGTKKHSSLVSLLYLLYRRHIAPLSFVAWKTAKLPVMKLSATLYFLAFSSCAIAAPISTILDKVPGRADLSNSGPRQEPRIKLPIKAPIGPPSKASGKKASNVQGIHPSNGQHQLSSAGIAKPSPKKSSDNPKKPKSYLASLAHRLTNKSPFSESSIVREETRASTGDWEPEATIVEWETKASSEATIWLPCFTTDKTLHYHRVRVNTDMLVVSLVLCFIAVVLVIELWKPVAAR